MRFLIICLLLPILSFSQTILKGEIANSGDNEGIHVFNKTYQKYTITDKKGGFEIPVRINDTVVFSAIQYKLKHLIITSELIKEQLLFVLLEMNVNELDEVFIKPKLSGNLLSDSQKIKTRDLITAKTLGLPNAHVIPPTQEERKLYTATHGGGLVSVDAIINAISGRTKMLKKQLKLAKKSKLENTVYSSFSQTMVESFSIPEDKVYDFLYYASSDELFVQIVKTKSNIIIYDFIQAKSKSYLKLIAIQK